MPRPSLPTLLASAPKVRPHDASYFSPLIFGAACDTILFGFLVHQLNSYLSHVVSKDTFANKLALLWATAVAAATTGLGIWHTWDMFVIHYGAWNRTLVEDSRGIAWFVLLSTLMILPMQVFFAARAYRTHGCGSPILYLVLTLVAIATVSGMGLAGTVRSLRKDDQVQRLAPWLWTWNSANLLCNVVLGLAVLTSLHGGKSWGTRRDHRVFRWTRITFELLLPCTAQSLGSLVSHAARPDSPVAWVWLVPAKLYLISALGVLNSRTSLRRPVPGRSSSCHKRDDSAKGQSDPLAEIRTFPLDEHTVITKSADFEAGHHGTTYSSEPHTLIDPPVLNIAK
ncbi:hypothetical protein DB88DRAFT_541951 [Papiliotrema laurentii]|uniref:Uncharacterized protein n=1 Tax=Papiliotrema laurentii TaxID=5418 RepID=A0AAD9FN96_PAPLA|nr:hypothetical protein DB88DRAFT_541951 [Papiliotrema laurentii]